MKRSQPASSEISRLFTIREVSEATQLSEGTLRAAVRRGDLRAVKLARAVRFEAEAVNDFLQRHETKGKAA
ncbi:MAG TPA: helix-turn-helix domain-containing protein [Tepidisphaeraceae bacterium]|nr:helix-turn-helix domain-containing protein [Tepidisphaeraceae bacterium]